MIPLVLDRCRAAIQAAQRPQPDHDAQDDAGATAGIGVSWLHDVETGCFRVAGAPRRPPPRPAPPAATRADLSAPPARPEQTAGNGTPSLARPASRQATWPASPVPQIRPPDP